jgi:putative PIN family toxin of toxin-antitoxin system
MLPVISRLASLYDVVYDIIMLSIVIDTDVMVSAIESDSGASRQLLLEVLDGRAAVFLSTALMLEYEDVLTRPETLARSRLAATDIFQVLDELALVCKPVTLDFPWRPVAKDPNDDHVIETAINGQADVIATFNLKDMTAGAAAFGIVVERPAMVLRRIRK